MISLRALVPFLCSLFCWVALAPDAAAAPSAGGSFSTNKGASGKSSGFELPEMVVGGNAISAQLPLQFGIVGYLPKARFAFQYDRQIRRSHWVHVGVAMVFDHAGYKNFRMDNCGLTSDGLCDKGGVLGIDVFAGYTYKFFIQDKPYIVPFVRGSLGYQFFALPKIGNGDGDRRQSRTKSWTLNVKPGGGVRVFLFSDFGVGADINLPIGFLVHTDVPEGGSRRRKGGFLLGIEVLPLVAEYRF